MNAHDHLAYLVNDLHTAVLATVDDNGLPVTCAVDMMDFDEGGLYFLTAKGKSLCDRMRKRPFVALTATNGQETMRCVAVSVRGKVRELGPQPLGRLLEKNPYMTEIYPTEASREALTVFNLHEGSGELFDLSVKPIRRESFTFGGAVRRDEGFEVTDACIGCNICNAKCPQGCIDISTMPVTIQQEHCVRCGNCLAACPEHAIVRRR